MNFYHELITQKSWELLVKLRQNYDFILIGGWAVYLYTHALKSKDIDLVLQYGELEKLKEEFMVSKNERLKKYEAKVEGLEIDIYLPYFSNPGLPAEELKKFSLILEGFQTLEAEVLAILKSRVLLERKDSVKGRKDLADLLCLFQLENFDWKKYRRLLKEYKLAELLPEIFASVQETNSLEELNLNVYRMSKLKRTVLPWLET